MNTYAYPLITLFYGDRTAKRSGVRLMNHIDEGLEILSMISSDDSTKTAYCLHPMMQSDDDLKQYYPIIAPILGSQDPLALLYIMEYRNIANAFLSNHEHLDTHVIKLSPLYQVNEMLYADKIQNRKDFEIYHKGTHPRSDELTFYFDKWMKALDIREEYYEGWVKRLTSKQ